MDLQKVIDNAKNINTPLSFEDMAKFVAEVTDACFVDDMYIPEARAYAQRSRALIYYCGWEPGDNLEENYMVALKIAPNFVTKVAAHQYDQIIDAIDNAIAFRKEQIIHHRYIDDLAQTVAALVREIDVKALLDKLDAVAREVKTQDASH